MNKYECVVKGSPVGSHGILHTHTIKLVVVADDYDSAVMAALQATTHLWRRIVPQVKLIKNGKAES